MVTRTKEAMSDDPLEAREPMSTIPLVSVNNFDVLKISMRQTQEREDWVWHCSEWELFNRKQGISMLAARFPVSCLFTLQQRR